MTRPAAPHREHLQAIYQAALEAVHGRRRVAEFLHRHPPSGPCQVVAVGKAAAAMAQGALDAAAGAVRRLLVVTAEGGGAGLEPVPGHAAPPLLLVEAGHPVPDARSLRAGRLLQEFIASAPAGEDFLVLISGGASALLEIPRPGITLEDLQRVNRWLLASGLAIRHMNAVRRRLSAVKGGGLAALLAGRRVLGLLLSDVPGDDPAVIASGLLAPAADPVPFEALSARIAIPAWLSDLLAAHPPAVPADAGEVETHVIATNRHARRAAARAARERGFAVHEHEDLLQGDVQEVARELAASLLQEPGLHVWGGEPTVRLPESPGRGGRCQHLALLVAQRLHRRGHFAVLAAGTDGRDGFGEAAGALVDGGTLARAARAGLAPAEALARADAGTLLAATGDLLAARYTGTNVMDLVLGLRAAEDRRQKTEDRRRMFRRSLSLRLR